MQRRAATTATGQGDPFAGRQKPLLFGASTLPSAGL